MKMKKNITVLSSLDRYKILTVEKEEKTIGGGHCYSKSCLRTRDKSMYSAGSFLAGYGYGVCQAVGACD
ncbi:hypothetical protein [Companilactobacillus nantensis]|uniref:Uncharacterized protein n=1 Tax=Companilactobacillus nantensis DSM 16982 TaxID=1423774 RepID=A0A0R1WJ96_9LACO|nr:hypothetical protein [Companilactobacillus nantensis]KRM15817.1 hypothetical protein FD31_GL000915 [Companilactobacillus nantensis DSM 16982]GEO64602.1 hypothetical protein LNA01_17850 [Companilactobacillus nantensis]